MPFTIAHAAAAVPVWRRTSSVLPLSALVVGSMVPDFEYLLRFSARTSVGHTLTGVPTFDLPVGLLVLWYFHSVLKASLVAFLPEPHRQHLRPLAARPFPLWPLPRLLLVVGALLLGAGTHLLWDSFTHERGGAVRLLPILQTQIPVGPWSVAVYKLLQYGCSVLGLALLTRWYLRWLHAQPLVATGTAELHAAAQAAAYAFVASCALVGGLVSVLMSQERTASRAFTQLVATFALGNLAGLCLALVLVAAFASLHPRSARVTARSR